MFFTKNWIKTIIKVHSLLFSPACLLLASFCFWLLTACTLQQSVFKLPPVKVQRLPFPAVRFIVFSDPHYFAPELGTSEAAFQNYIRHEPKLLAYSKEILTSLVGNLEQEEADFILVCGDLTKDGEKISHEQVAQVLYSLEANHKAVYVIPGNHDVANSNACRYHGTTTEPAESVSPAEFADIYADFGYREALYRDPASLSYIAEPVPGLWLFALDSCANNPVQVDIKVRTAGHFSPATIRWIKTMLALAQSTGKAVIACQHHALLEHYPGQKKYYKDYIIANNEQIARLFATWNLSLVFTGHYHAQDVIKHCWQEKDEKTFLYDLMTGSTINYPCPYRVVQITTKQKVVIRTKYIDSIASFPQHFVKYVYRVQYEYILNYVAKTLVKYRVDKKSAFRLAEQLAELAMANFGGDEQPNKPLINFKGISLWGRLAARTRFSLFQGMATDLPPPDNNLTIDFQAKDLPE